MKITLLLYLFVGTSALAQPEVPNSQLATFLWHSTGGIDSTNRADVAPHAKAPQIILVYENERDSCGSGGCVLDIVANDARSLRLLGRQTLVWPPVALLGRDKAGFPILGVLRHGGGILKPYCDELRFNGKKYVSAELRGSSGKYRQCKEAKEVLIKWSGFRRSGS